MGKRGAGVPAGEGVAMRTWILASVLLVACGGDHDDVEAICRTMAERAGAACQGQDIRLNWSLACQRRQTHAYGVPLPPDLQPCVEYSCRWLIEGPTTFVQTTTNIDLGETVESRIGNEDAGRPCSLLDAGVDGGG